MVSAPSIGILTGPTATGKTQLAIQLIQKYCPSIEIINADSLLVYREMTIGTAKPSIPERQNIPHHLIDICNPDKNFTAGDFFRLAHEALKEIEKRKKKPLIVGGTGFYLKALLYGLWQAPKANVFLRAQLEEKTNIKLYEKLLDKDLSSAQRIGPSDRYRLIRALEIILISGKTPTALQAQVQKIPNPRLKLWVIDRPTSDLHQRIHERTKKMLQNGCIEEVQRLQENFPNTRGLQAVGYAQICDYLVQRKPSGRKIKLGLEGLQEEIELATRQLVKKQRTWFRGQSAAQWFKLEQELPQLEEEFKKVYL